MNLSLALPLLITICGAVLLVRLRFFFIFHPIRTARLILPTLRDRKTRSSFLLALAGTLGVGNIFGVCAGLMIGGAGSVLWLLVSSVFSMVIKYAECTSVFSSPVQGGIHRTILTTFSRLGKPLSLMYAALCASLSLFMGSAIQSGAVADIASSSYGIPPLICAFILSFFLLIAVIGGVSKIEKITEKLVPLTTVIYILLAFLVIIANVSRLPSAICRIFTDAFSVRSVGGGTVAFLNTKALYEGFARGILSNEAGSGTSSLAHSRSSGRSAAAAGVSGIFEVFFDTTVLCVLTALAVLCAVPDISAYQTPMSLICAAICSVSELFSLPLLISIFIFAYSTVICWFYYGEECICYLFGDRFRRPFTLIFVVFIFVGASVSSRALISLTDVIIFAMSLITLATVMKNINAVSDTLRDI